MPANALEPGRLDSRALHSNRAGTSMAAPKQEEGFYLRLTKSSAIYICSVIMHACYVSTCCMVAHHISVLI